MPAVQYSYLQSLCGRLVILAEAFHTALTKQERLLTAPNVDHEECWRQWQAVETHGRNFGAVNELFLDALRQVAPSN